MKKQKVVTTGPSTKYERGNIDLKKHLENGWYFVYATQHDWNSVIEYIIEKEFDEIVELDK